MKEEINKQENGITLIALVITIIVLLILAGVAIGSLVGENGILKKAKDAKIQTEIGQIQEILDLAVIEGTMLEKSEEELFDFSISELEERGYNITTKIDSSTSSINKIELSETKVQVKENANKVITVIADETSYTNRYYVKIEKQYYELVQEGDRIKVAENESDLDNISGETTKKEIKVTGANYSTVAINQETKEITITGGQNLGTDTLIVEYGGKTASCTVEVGSYITSLILNKADGTKITNGMEINLNIGDGLIITATTNSDAKEQISWTNSNTSVTPMTVSENKKTVNLTGSTVGKSTITASTAKIKISFTVNVAKKINEIQANKNIVITGNKKTLVDDNNEQIVVPEGFKIKEDSPIEVKRGIVVVAPDGSEFVWVPVTDINKMVKVTSGTDSKGRTNYQGKLYEFKSENGVYSATERTSYGQGTTSYREPSLVTGNGADTKAALESVTGTSYDASSNYYNTILGYSSAKEFGKAMQEEYNEMIESVKTNKGFYVGRYETSLNTTTKYAQSISGETSATAASDSANTWYGLYQKQKEYSKNNGITDKVGSNMIWGSQYDQMMIWMQTNRIDVTSTNPKNLEGITTSKNESQTTGLEPKDKLNNIYDLLGNRFEWTLEANNTDSRVSRGGNRS